MKFRLLMIGFLDNLTKFKITNREKALIRNLKVLSEECLTYETAKKYMYSSKNRILIKIICLASLIVLYLNLYKIMYFLIYSKMSIEIGIFSYMGVGVLIGVFIWIILRRNDAHNLKVKLIFSSNSKKLTIYLNNKKKADFYPNFIEAKYDYIPAMSRSNQLPTPIFCLNLYSLNRAQKYSLVTIDCTNMIITKNLFDQFILEYQPLIEWLNLPVHKDGNLELMKYYFRD